MSPTDPNTPDRNAESSDTKSGRLASAIGNLRPWLAANRLRAGLIVGVCLVSVAAVIVAWVIIASQPSAGYRETLDSALAALDRGDFITARESAEALQALGKLPASASGGPVFVLGAAAAREADSALRRDRKELHLLAARYLEEARDRGFPPGREAEGLHLLGRSLSLSGQPTACRPPLLESLEADDLWATDIHRLLARAYFDDATPDYEKALEHSTLLLADEQLSSDERHAGLVHRAEILLHLNRPADCLATLDEVPADAANRAEASLLRGRLLMHRARALADRDEVTAEEKVQVEEHYRAAIKTLQTAEGQDTLATRVTGKSMYLIGVCYRELGDDQAALGQFARTAELYAEGPEQAAAVLHQAELARRLQQHADALAAYVRALKSITAQQEHRNPWIPLDELRRQMLEAYEYYLSTENYAILVPLARHLEPLLGRARALELRAEAHEAWGRDCLQRAVSGLPEDSTLRSKGRAELRRAGWALLELAREELTTREYPDHLWNAADAYLTGNDYTQAILVLKKYLREETRRRRAEGLVRLGRALLAVGRLDEAAAALAECIEFHPRDPAIFEARLLVARTYVEQARPEKAIELLEANLRGEQLTPASREWRNSLFALGEVLHVEGRYDEAIRRLEEAVARYNDDPRALQARYLLADACRRSAELLQDQLQQPPGGAGQGAPSQQIRDRYQQALAHYAEVRQRLGRRQETDKLSLHEAALLRNCYFTAGSILLKLGQIEAAIQQYATATNRYQNSPEVLEAYVQIARAYRQIDKPMEARGTLEQAKVVLGRLEPTEAFVATTNYTAEQWAERLDWLSSL